MKVWAAQPFSHSKWQTTQPANIASGCNSSNNWERANDMHGNLPANEVELWKIELSLQEYRAEDCDSLLSADEKERASRLIFERDRMRFVISRTAMRGILSEYLGIAPHEISFSYSSNGKPELALRFRESGIKFNLSHSGELALLAVARDLCVGIDIEFIDENLAMNEMALLGSQQESIVLSNFPSEQKSEAFFKWWTRKEAFTKMLGVGLSLPLDSFDVAFGPKSSGALPPSDGVRAEPENFSIYDIPVLEKYAAALAVEGKDHRLQKKQWRGPAEEFGY